MKKITFLLLTFLITNYSFAQISYTDIADTSLEATGPNWDPEGIDFNNDGTLDIDTFDGVNFTLFDPTFTFESRIWATGDINGGWDEAQPIAANTTIDVSGNYQSFGDASMNQWGAGTIFPLNQDAYLAFEINLSGITHYAWVRVMWNGANFIYKDYAYNTTPNAAINAGQTTLAIEEYSNTINVSYYPNPSRDVISIKTNQTIEEAYLIDILGKTTVLNINNNSVNISVVPNGVYFLYVKSAKNTAIKKIIKI